MGQPMCSLFFVCLFSQWRVGMLHQVLQAFETAREPLNLNDLAAQLQIDPGTLDGMIGYWIRKGRLREVQSGGSCSCDSSGPSCGTGGGCCSFAGKMPRTIMLVPPEERAGHAGR
jgi:hypothetical protein